LGQAFATLAAMPDDFMTGTAAKARQDRPPQKRPKL
jgi:hypothetical protein